MGDFKIVLNRRRDFLFLLLAVFGAIVGLSLLGIAAKEFGKGISWFAGAGAFLSFGESVASVSEEVIEISDREFKVRYELFGRLLSGRIIPRGEITAIAYQSRPRKYHRRWFRGPIRISTAQETIGCGFGLSPHSAEELVRRLHE